MRKKFFLLFSVVTALLLGVFLFAGCEEESVSLPSLEYKLSEDGTYYIVTGIGTVTEEEIVIPAQKDGLPVKEIGLSAFATESLKSVTLCEGIEFIGEQAFAVCENLEKVILPDSLTTLQNGTFWGCGNLREIVFGDGLKSIAPYTFEGCANLTNVVFPKKLEEIGTSAFESCRSLERFTLPESLRRIEYRAFHRCTSLQEIAIPDGVTFVAEQVFSYCDSLTSIDMRFDRGVFGNTDKKYLSYLFGDQRYGAGTPVPATLTEIIFSAESEIDESCFSYSDTLFSVDIQETPHIGSYAFERCDGLKEVAASEGLEEIAAWAFYDCGALERVYLPDTLTYIGEYAFRNCSALREICFEGTIEQWTAIQKERYWNFGAEDYIVYCSDGNI